MAPALAWLLLAQVAVGGAGGYYIESAPFDTRPEAVALRRQVEGGGGRARVRRRRLAGGGRSYVVVVVGFDDEEAAQAEARRIARATDWGVAVYEEKPGGPPAGPDDAPAPAGAGPAAHLRERVLEAVGGHGGGAPVIAEAERVHFRYERTVLAGSDRIEVVTDWWRAPDLRRLEVHVEKGRGRDSLLLVRDDDAELRVGGQVIQVDAARAREIIEYLGPERLLAAPLRLPSMIEVLEGPAALYASEPEPDRDGGGPVLVAANGRIRIEVAPGSMYPGLLTLDGEVSWRMDDWRELGDGLVLPFELALRRDVELEQLRVLELSLDPPLPEDLGRGGPAEP